VLHQYEKRIEKSIPDARYFSTARPKENLEVGRDGFPNTSRVLVEYKHSLINISTYKEWIMKPFPVDRGGLTVSLLMMKECNVKVERAPRLFELIRPRLVHTPGLPP